MNSLTCEFIPLIFRTKFTSNKMLSSRALEMFQSGQGADCVIEVVPHIDGQEKQEFNVHKFVLMLNSDVFQAMFSHETTKEARKGRIRITDSTMTAVHQMLIYLYTDELPEEFATETDAGPLMHIANKYQIQSLVQLIERKMVNSLSLENVFDRLEMADLYQIHSLYASCGQLIGRKIKMVKKDVKWLELKKKAPELAFAILEDVDEFGNGKISKIISNRNKMSNNRALEMFQNGQGTDCVIELVPQIDGQDPEITEFNVHKYVLMVNSDVFHAMFSHENTKEARECRIAIKDSTAKALRQMLIYMYTDELQDEYAIEMDAGPLLYIANKYQIKSLVREIQWGLINSLSLGNVLDRLEMADLYQMKSLYSSCGQLIRRNLKILKTDAKWLELEKKSPELASFLTSKDDDEKTGEAEEVTSSHGFAASHAATNIYHPTLKTECSWFLLMLFSHLAMWIALNMVALVLLGWLPFFHFGMWMWSIPGFLLTIIFSNIPFTLHYHTLAVGIVADAKADDAIKRKMQKYVAKILADADADNINISKKEGKDKCEWILFILVIFSSLVAIVDLHFNGYLYESD